MKLMPACVDLLPGGFSMANRQQHVAMLIDAKPEGAIAQYGDPAEEKADEMHRMLPSYRAVQLEMPFQLPELR
jgi:hypothetical protein